ncbi:hypothetical protein BV96_03995 [Sphingomonas paucimobilis]|nr:hypothetical protein BV96_03995 [Sphingomonas paucimobilis]
MPAAAQVIDPFSNGGSVERSGTGSDVGRRLPNGNGLSDIFTPVDNGPDGAARGVPVSQRPRPDYDPPGVKVGGFAFYPEATAALVYNSNIYAQDNGVGDVAAKVRAGGVLQSNWGRHALSVDGYIDQRTYAKYSSEDALTYAASAAGKLNITSRNQVSANLGYTRQVVDRSLIGEELATRRPIRYNLATIGLGARHAFSRVAVNVTGAIGRYDFKDAQTLDGQVSNQQYRDFMRYQAGIDLSYRFGPGPRAFLSANGEWRRYRVDRGISRDADIYEVLGGLRGEITPLLQGTVGLGYITANFADPSIKSRSAVALSGSLAYLVTELTTVNLSLRRYYQNVGLVAAPATLNTEGSLGVDHELLRNIILSASGNYIDSSYIAAEGSARRYGASFNARWLIDRKMRFDLALDYHKRRNERSTIIRDFDQLRASATLRYHL